MSSQTDIPHLAQSHLHSIPSSICANSVGVYLTDSDTSKWAQCSHHSLAQLQRYVFKCAIPVPHMFRLSMAMRRCQAAFGLASVVMITTATEWAQDLARLPPVVKCVKIRITSQQELDMLYSPVKEGLAVREDDSPVVCLPSHIRELDLSWCHNQAMERWIQHLTIPSDSCLQSLQFPALVPWTSLPRFIRHSLPNTLVELTLPCFKNTDTQPAAEQYPTHWPPNLTKMRIEYDDRSPLVVGSLPPLPQSLTTMEFPPSIKNMFSSNSHLQGVISRIPDSVISLDLNRIESIDGSWKLPAGLLTLCLSDLTEILHKPVKFAFPLMLRELSVQNFLQPQLLNTLLPATLTALTIHPPSINRPFADMCWPANLLTLNFYGNTASNLRGWTPPPHLTELIFNWWDTPLDGVALPTSLRSLTFRDYSHSLADVIFPPNLEHIAFLGADRVPSLSRNSWTPPLRLASLTLTKYDTDVLFLPPTLRKLVGGCNFNPSSFNLLENALPANLQELDLRDSRSCCSALDVLPIPPHLQYLRLCSDPWINGDYGLDRFPTSKQLPASLRWLQLGGRLFLPKTDWPKITKWAVKTLPAQCAFSFQ